MTWLENATLILAILGFTGYLIQILMLVGCCDKYISLQVNLFRFTVITMLLTLIGVIALMITK